MIRILFIDDEPRLQRAWQRMIAQHGDMQIVGTRSTADDLGAAVDATSPDVVIIDLTMPGRDPLEAVRELSTSHPDVRAIIYSGHSDVERINLAFDAGAWGYLDKLAATDEIVAAIRRVASGQVEFSGHPLADGGPPLTH